MKQYNWEVKSGDAPALTAVIPISRHRDDFERLNSWISSSKLDGFKLILVFDQCSPDYRYESLVNSSTASEIEIIQGEFGGPGFARNAGLQQINSVWTCFWDSDDLPHIEDLKRAIHELSSSQADIGICEFDIKHYSQDGTLIKVEEVPHNSESLFAIVNSPGIWRFIFRTSHLIGNHFPNTRMGEDQVFLAQALCTTSNIEWLRESIYSYIKDGQPQLTTNREAINELINSTTIIYNSLIDKKLSKSKFRVGLIIKQCVTILKHSNYSLKYKATTILMKLFLLHFWSFVSALYDFLTYVSIKPISKTHVTLNGGLGNQLFELSAGLYVSKNFNVVVESNIGVPRTNTFGLATIQDFSFPESIRFSKSPRWQILTKASNFTLRAGLTESHTVITRIARVLTTILASIYIKSPIGLIVNKGVGWSKVQKFQWRSQLLIGYFQTYKLQDARILNILRSSFAKVEGDELEQLRKLADIEKPLVVHIRLSDYRNEPNFGIPSSSYYRSAISAIYDPEIHNSIWLFSDEIKEARSRIPVELQEITREIASVDGSDHVTLVAMTLGHDYVIANSTYSWWAARLSKNENARVIYPSPWFSKMAEPKDLFPPHWVAYPAEFEKP